MKKLLITLSFLFCISRLFAQSSIEPPVRPDSTTIYVAVEQEPVFKNFKEYIAKNKKQPDIEGTYKTKVFVHFVVERDGSLSDIKVIRGIDDMHDQEAIKLLKQSPKWQPGLQNGKTVRCMYTVVVSYQKPQ